jgi:hypothetical protein
LLTDLAAKELSGLPQVARQANAMARQLQALSGPEALQALATSDLATAIAKAADDLAAGLQPLAAGIGRLRQIVEEWRAAERRSRRGRFEEGVRGQGWSLVGSWPEPVVEHTVFIVVDEAKDSATVNGRTVSGVPTAEKLIGAAAQEVELLARDRTTPEDFILQVWKAYCAAGGQPGQGVPVFDLLRALVWVRQSKRFQRDPRSEFFRPYPLAQFRADLTHYLGSGLPPARDGKQTYALEIAAGSFAQDGLFMFFPQTERLASCGRLTFQPPKPGGTS